MIHAVAMPHYGARIVAETIDAYVPGSLSDVRFIAYSDEEFETVWTVVESVRTSE